MVMSAVQVTPATVWRSSSAVYLVYLAVASFISVRSRDRFSIGVVPWGFVGALVGVSTVLNLYNFFGPETAWPYLGALGFGLTIACTQFAFALRRLFAS